jgi:hypothetical protein
VTNKRYLFNDKNEINMLLAIWICRTYKKQLVQPKLNAMNKYLSHSIFLIIAPFVSAQMDETRVILEGLESRKFSVIHTEEFILRSKEYFNIQKDLTQIPSIKVGRESFTLYPQHGFYVPQRMTYFTTQTVHDKSTRRRKYCTYFKTQPIG